MSDINIEKLRVSQDLAQQVIDQQKQARKLKRGEWRRSYTQVPRAWEIKLREAKRISTYRLAIELLYRHWLGKGQPVTVADKMVADVGLSARSKSRALVELAELGLITIDRNAGRSPRVALRFVEAA
jgi:DNA-binding transcriptional ArsR family regulator